MIGQVGKGGGGLERLPLFVLHMYLFNKKLISLLLST